MLSYNKTPGMTFGKLTSAVLVHPLLMFAAGGAIFTARWNEKVG